MGKRFWLMKSEPDVYSWDDLVSEGEGTWDGVRNHRAKNNLAAMQVGDEAFFYHSREGLEIVGICEVSVAGITDPTDPEGKWAAVKVKPKTKLPHPVTLKQIKAGLDSSVRSCYYFRPDISNKSWFDMKRSVMLKPDWEAAGDDEEGSEAALAK